LGDWGQGVNKNKENLGDWKNGEKVSTEWDLT